jgi:predicted Rossmann fold nucleotide-binding protein DprA/Smf involved in DNA uptake
MSGLSDATVVVEADETSGAMITANLAIDQGRKVFAVPGKVGESGSEGPNMLIRDGALPCVCAEDILSEFEFIYKNKISVDVAHARVRKLDFETLSLNAMDRMRIGTSAGGKNYRGKGTYGGRIKDNPVAKAAFEESKTEAPRDTQPVKSAASVNMQNKTPAKKQKRSLLSTKKAEFPKNIKENIKNTEEKMIPAHKIDLDMLESKEIKVYNMMKPNVPVLPDSLVNADTNISDIMSALTMLEIAGAVESGGGGYFMRVSEEDIMLSEND